jgi:hypothetical protein
VKKIVTKFNVGKTEGYDILRGKSEISDKIMAMVQIKLQLQKLRNEDIIEIVWRGL